MVVVVYHQVYFNSQPHKEADEVKTEEPNVWKLFQLTASQGG